MECGIVLHFCNVLYTHRYRTGTMKTVLNSPIIVISNIMIVSILTPNRVSNTQCEWIPLVWISILTPNRVSNTQCEWIPLVWNECPVNILSLFYPIPKLAMFGVSVMLSSRWETATPMMPDRYAVPHHRRLQCRWRLTLKLCRTPRDCDAPQERNRTRDRISN